MCRLSWIMFLKSGMQRVRSAELPPLYLLRRILQAQCGPKIALRGGGGGMAWAPGEGGVGGGGFQKWASVPGALFCVWTDVATKGAGTQILARKNFFHEKIFPHMCVVKMISATWGSF